MTNTAVSTRGKLTKAHKTMILSPVNNMGEKGSGLTTVEGKVPTYGRNLENYQMVMTSKGPKPVLLRKPAANEIAILDWVNLTGKFPDKIGMASPEDKEKAIEIFVEGFLSDEIQYIIGVGVSKKRPLGMNNYHYSWLLEDGMGVVCAGGQNNTYLIMLNGTACATGKDGWENRLYNFATTEMISPKLTRVDVAHDDIDGDYLSVDWAYSQTSDEINGFWCGGRPPTVEKRGDWDRPNGKGRTLYIGTRDAGKYCRFYEKGKKEGDKQSLWCRAEVEFKATDRVIPFEILIAPSGYFLAAYPCLEQFAVHIQPQKICIEKKKSKINWDASFDITSHQFGRYLFAYRQVLTDKEILDRLTKGKSQFPKRLIPSQKLAQKLAILA